MLNWVIGKWSWKSFAVGTGVALFGGAIARPLLVAAVKSGLDVKDFLDDTIQTAKEEASSIRAAALKMRAMESAAQPGAAELISELRKLREEMEALKGGFGHKPASKS